MALNVKTDFGAVGDGINNDSVPIQNAINSIINPLIPDSGGEIVFPEGNYLIEDLLIINQGRDIKLYLEKNAKLFTIKHGYGILEISNSHNICVQGGKFFGRGDFPSKNYSDTHGGGEKFFTNAQGIAWGHWRNAITPLPAYNGGHLGSCGIGILIRNGSTRIEVSQTNIQKFNYSGVQVQFLGDDENIQSNYCRDITISSNNIQKTYSAGISVHGAFGTIVTNNHISKIGHPDADGSEPIVNPGYGVTARSIKYNDTEAKNSIITDNNFSHCNAAGIDSHASKGLLVTGNTFYGCYINGISMTGSSGERNSTIIMNNLIKDSGNVSGGEGIPNNPNFKGIPKTGIKNYNSNTIINNNILKNSGFSYGIYNSKSYVSISNNDIYYDINTNNQYTRGVFIEGKLENEIIGNRIIGNSISGNIKSSMILKFVKESVISSNISKLNQTNEILKLENCRINILENDWGSFVFNNGNLHKMTPVNLCFTVEWKGGNQPLISYSNYNSKILIGDFPGLLGQVIKFESGTKNPLISDPSKLLSSKISYINKIGINYVALIPDISGSQLWCHISPRNNLNNVIASNSPLINGLKIQVEIDLILQV